MFFLILTFLRDRSCIHSMFNSTYLTRLWLTSALSIRIGVPYHVFGNYLETALHENLRLKSYQKTKLKCGTKNLTKNAELYP